MADWFGRLPKRVESRQDTYLLDPRLEGLSVKIRGDTRLEVKLQDGTSEVFDLPGRARGRMSSWQKWSFPIGSEHQQIRDSPDWRRVEKVRGISWFSPTGELLPAPPPGEESPAGCTVELTDIVISGEAWWTLGFEATGPPRGRQRRYRVNRCGGLSAQACPTGSRFAWAIPSPTRRGCTIDSSGICRSPRSI